MDPNQAWSRRRVNYHDHGLSSYAKLFSRANGADEARVLLEATPYYLYQETAREVLSSLNPQPHIVCLLRRVADRLYSVFQFTKHHLGRVPKDLTFRQFVNSLRTGSAPYLEGSAAVHLRKEIDYSRYVTYLQKWLSCFDRTRAHVYLLEQLVAAPRVVVQDVSRKTGISAAFYENYPFNKWNATARRSQSVHKIARKLSRRFARFTGRRMPMVIEAVYQLFQETPASPKSEDDREVLRELDEEYSSYNAVLQKEVGIDLSVWSTESRKSEEAQTITKVG